MPTNQGWTMPPNSRVRHYVLQTESLCKRWSIEGLFVRSVNIVGFDLQPGIPMCVDCKRRLQQKLRLGTLPVLPPDFSENLPFILPRL